MSRVTVAKFDDLVEGTGKRVDVGEERVAVFRVGDQAYAIADRCSHAEASLSDGELFGTEVECPRHGAEFDITTGAALTLPATTPVAAYPVEVVDGGVQITIGGTSA